MKQTIVQIVQKNKYQKKITSQVAQKMLLNTARLCFVYPMVGFYAFLQPMQAYAQYIPDIDQITKVERIVESALPFYVFQGRTPNIMMPLSVEWPITSAAWRLPEDIRDENVIINNRNYTLNNVHFNNGFLPERNYTGYFNPTGCYIYDTTEKMFIYRQQNDNSGACPTNQFAGGALNWAGLTTLDLARYALTGGNRVVDSSDLSIGAPTVIARARVFTWANDVFYDFNPNTSLWTIAEHTKRFPIKVFDTYGINGRGTSTVKYSRTCGTTLYVTRDNDYKKLLTHADCAQLRDINSLDRYEMRVKVCDAADANTRPQYCQRYPDENYKPVGILQQKSSTSRIGTMGYLNYGRDIVNDLRSFGKNPRMPANIPLSAFQNQTDPNKKLEFWIGERIRHLSGGVLRAPHKFLGASYYNDKLNFADNPLREFDYNTGVIFDKGAGARLLTSDGMDAPQDGGPSVIGYTNKFGRNNYVETDDLTELTSEALRYMSNQGGPSAPVHLPNGVSGDMTRQPFYFKKVWTSGSDGVTALPNQKLNASQLASVMQKHYDFFPVIEEWKWKKTPTENKPDEPIRTKCEAQNIPRMIMLSDINNWHATTAYDQSLQFKTSTRIVEDGVLKNPDIKDALNSYVNANKAVTNQHLSESQPMQELTQDPTSPKYTHPTQNRYVAAAITALANLDGVYYKGTAINRVTPQIRIKSSMIDVGEPLITSLMNANQTKLRSNGKAEDCHLFYAGALGTANSLGDFISQFGSDACQNFLNARDQNANNLDTFMPPGYFYPSNPQKMINNIRQAFEIPFEISGNLQVGAVGKVSDLGDKVPVFQFNLDVLQNKRDQTSHLRSLPKKYVVAATNNGQTITEDLQWPKNLYTSMRRYGSRTIFVGTEKLDDDVAKNASFQNFPIFTNAATEFSGNSLESREKMTERLINFFRGDISSEGTIFRKRSIAGEVDSLISSTQNSNPIVIGKTKTGGAELVYVSSNDGMLHAINTNTGNIRFSYIPQNLAAKMGQTALEGYQNSNLFESILLGGKVYDNNQKRTIVGGGFGLGQKGVFALDVTDIHENNTQFDADNALFEFTDKDDIYMGNVIGQPEILTFSTTQNGVVKKQSYMAVTSGYKYDGRTTQNPHLFLLKIDTNKKGLGIVNGKNWVLNQDYFRIEIKDASFNKRKDNGVTTSQSFIFNQKVVATYFGDLYGNLWKVSNLDQVISNRNSQNAKVVRLYEGLNNVAASNGSQLQAITAKPNLILSNKGGIMVTFGTGRLLGINDLGSKNHTEQAMIGVRDRKNITTGLNKTNIKASDLAKHSINDNLNMTQASTDKTEGWYVKLPDQSKGMRIVTTPRILSGTVIFSTQAAGNFSVDECGENTGGLGILNAETGRPDGLNNSFDRYNRVLGEILVIPALSNGLNSPSAEGTSTRVNTKVTNFKKTLFIGAANNMSSGPSGPSGPVKKDVNLQAKSGILSWRIVEDDN